MSMTTYVLANICWGYSLEVPLQGASNEYHNICFPEEIRKISSRAMYLNELTYTNAKLRILISNTVIQEGFRRKSIKKVKSVFHTLFSHSDDIGFFAPIMP